MSRWRDVGAWLQEVLWLRGQRRSATRDLERLGFDTTVLHDLPHLDLMRLARWISRPLTWGDPVLGLLSGLLTSQIIINRSPELGSGWPAIATVLLFAATFAGAAALLSGVLNAWGRRIFDYYYDFGQSGGRIIRALGREASGELFRKERAIRAAHAWRRTGRRGGVDFEQRHQRVFVLLTQTPMDKPGTQEICDNVRAAMLDALAGKVDPEGYQEPRRIWHEREHLEFLNQRITLIITFIGLLAVVGFWPAG